MPASTVPVGVKRFHRLLQSRACKPLMAPSKHHSFLDVHQFDLDTSYDGPLGEVYGFNLRGYREAHIEVMYDRKNDQLVLHARARNDEVKDVEEQIAEAQAAGLDDDTIKGLREFYTREPSKIWPFDETHTYAFSEEWPTGLKNKLLKAYGIK